MLQNLLKTAVELLGTVGVVSLVYLYTKLYQKPVKR